MQHEYIGNVWRVHLDGRSHVCADRIYDYGLDPDRNCILSAFLTKRYLMPMKHRSIEVSYDYTLIPLIVA